MPEKSCFLAIPLTTRPVRPIVNQGIFIANQRQNYRQNGYFFETPQPLRPKLLRTRSLDTFCSYRRNPIASGRVAIGIVSSVTAA
jgi:hypothetical protein